MDELGSRVAWVPSLLTVETLIASRMLETTPPADALGKSQHPRVRAYINIINFLISIISSYKRFGYGHHK
jgi:hypothetical protein